MLILHVFDHSIPLHSGYTFRSRAILRQQRVFGWRTEHLTSPKHGGEQSSEEVVDGLRFYRSGALPGWVDRAPAINQWAVVRRLARRLEEVARLHRPDLIHAHSPALNGLAAIRVGQRLGVPVVYEVRAFWEDAAVDHGTAREGGPRYRLGRALETHVLRRADAITTICNGLRDEIVSRGIEPAKVTVVPNAVNLEQFRRDRPPSPRLGRDLGLQGAAVLGFIGSFYSYEGLGLLLRAMPAILAERPEARLLLVGGGPQDRVLRHQAEELGLKTRVTFTGRVPHEQVQDYYDLVDIFVYPRLAMRLTDLVTPLKPLEAMASNRLVVASDVGGHKELIRDRETGFLFPAGDAAALAKTIVECLENRREWPRLHRQGRELVELERSWPAVVSRYQGVYGRLLGQG
jgi:PEP-CTERM/exosortase A-associated glycosyltransferase